ncbi:MAG: tRNA 2-thiouridine(34) synthase MnmA, partial [Actinobacteria bacterium]|nr:tRNA 2-thiouridine(34) synthase MnmA [Actinomycetota bacterium]
HYVYDFSVHMQEYIIKPFIESYLKGRTPNPCIECNRFLKFDILLEKAKALGFDYIATGHYAGIVKVNGSPFLARALDRKKDQSYFLYSIMKKNLGNIIFPLHKLTKQEVRKILCDIGLKISDKKDSQEICFITNDDYRDFIRKSKIKYGTGKIIDTNGHILGDHHGVFNYTIGQRKGIGISASYPLYVLEINVAKNLVVVGSKSHLEKRRLIAREINLFVDKLPACAKAKIRYNHEETNCRIKTLNNGSIEVTFNKPQNAISPGQSIVFYENDIVPGGAVISEC